MRLTDARRAVLTVLAQDGRGTILGIADTTGINRNTVKHILQESQRYGLVTKMAAPWDSRVAIYFLQEVPPGHTVPPRGPDDGWEPQRWEHPILRPQGAKRMEWGTRTCVRCQETKLERPDHFRMMLDGRTGQAIYEPMCVPCERYERDLRAQRRRNEAHRQIVRERKEHSPSFERIVEELERVHGPQSQWSSAVHMTLSQRLYELAGIARYAGQPMPIPHDEPVLLPLDYSDPRRRPMAAR